MTTALHGNVFLHEFADGRLMEFRRDHAYSPDLFVECRLVRPDGEPFDDVWHRVHGDGWAWCEATCPELMAEIRAERVD